MTTHTKTPHPTLIELTDYSSDQKVMNINSCAPPYKYGSCDKMSKERMAYRKYSETTKTITCNGNRCRALIVHKQSHGGNCTLFVHDDPKARKVQSQLPISLLFSSRNTALTLWRGKKGFQAASKTGSASSQRSSLPSSESVPQPPASLPQRRFKVERQTSKEEKKMADIADDCTSRGPRPGPRQDDRSVRGAPQCQPAGSGAVAAPSHQV